ncbi:MAG TPA: VTT domain-containing protein [Gammaproteobacteria bacterium]|nr:VTT domain-containing protein [Gammaproteobacteria bacterium]
MTPILQWLNENPELAGLATFIISASESVAIIGTIVPGSVTMTAIGALAGSGIIPLWSTLVWAMMGAIVGDGISYWIGHYFKDRLRQMWPFKDNPGILEKGEAFVHKYGVTSVFIGRFVGPVRALVPVVAGMLGMKPLQFTIANVTSAIGWAPAYMLPGIILGAASMELPPDIALHVTLGLIMGLLFFALCCWLVYKILQLIHIQIDQMQNWIWKRMKTSRVLYPITVILKHHDKHRAHGQLNLAFYFLIFSTLFIALAIYVKQYSAASLTVNEAIFHLFRGARQPWLDNIMIDITLLGQKQVIYPVIIVIFGYLLYSKHFREASHAFMLGIFGAGSVFVFKHVIESTRPWGIMNNAETFSMPSGHTTMSAILYIGLAFLIANSMHNKKWRWMIYTAAFLLALAVGVSRLYLGAHWFTDVISAWLLASAILCFVIISYERAKVIHVNATKLFAIVLVCMTVSYGLYHHKNMTKLVADYTQKDWPVIPVKMVDWWTDDNEIPSQRTSLFGFPSQRINIQWVGSLEEINKTLISEGWSQPPERDWISMMHRVADISSTQYLPMISPQYQDKTPALIMTKNLPGIKNLVVMRIWDSSRIIAENKLPIWVGTVGIVPRTYSWVYKKQRVPNPEMQPDLVFTNKVDRNWSHKMIAVDENGKHQKILLIRPSR